MNMVHVAIIDDGVNEKLYNIGSLKNDLEITEKIEVAKRTIDNTYRVSHGTICAAIMKKYNPNLIISSIKVLDKNGRGMKEKLIKGIKWCIDNNIKLINLSLGTIEYGDFDIVRNIVNEAYYKGIIIVAAHSNRGLITYPASLSNVIGVKCDRENRIKDNEFIYNLYSIDGIEITANGRHLLTNIYGDENIIEPSNSFAAPIITAFAGRILQKSSFATLENIKEELRKKSINYSNEKDYIGFYRKVDWIKEAILFNIGSKLEMSIINICKFKINKVINYPYNNIEQALHCIKKYIYKNSKFLKSAETVIISLDRGILRNDDLKIVDFLLEINEYDKDIVFLDDQFNYNTMNYKYNNLSKKIWNPAIYKCENIYFQGENPIPVITVVDFTEKKLIDIVNNLRDSFIKDDYYAVAATTMSKGILAGLEYINFKFNEKVDFLSEINTLCKFYAPDIFIAGVTIAHNNLNIDLGFKEQLLQSDIVIFIMDKFIDVTRYLSVYNTKLVVLCDKTYECEGITVLSNLKNDYIDKLYKLILESFENQ